MSTLTIFVVVFVALLIIGGWISAEYMSNKATRANKKFQIQLAKLERECDSLQNQLTTETNRYSSLKEEFEKYRDAKDQIRALEKDYKKLNKQHERVSLGVVLLREKLNHKKYSANSLTKEVLRHLDEHCPSEAQVAISQSESMREKFKRIKQSLSGQNGNEEQ